MALRLLLASVILLVWPGLSGHLMAQGKQTDTQSVWFQGKRLGYVPAHLKNRRAGGPVKRGAGNGIAATGRDTTVVETAAAETREWHGIETPVSQAEREGLPDSRSNIIPASLAPAPPQPAEIFAEPAVVTAPVAHGVEGCWWGRAEFLLFWTQRMNVPALATSGNAADAVPAALGQPGTQTLFGAAGLNDEARSGGRFTIGNWLDPCKSCGWEFSYLFLDDENTGFRSSNNDFAVLGRPFTNTTTGADARLIADPGVLSGTLSIVASTEFQSAEVLFRRACSRSQWARVDFVFGYRFAELEDRLRFDESTLALSGAAAGTRFDLFDEFQTRNSFHGGQVGLIMQWQSRSCWQWEALVKVALGGSEGRTAVAGQTITTDAVGSATTTSAGLLVQGTNSGVFRVDDFATVTELGLSLKGEVHAGLTLSFGYTFLYWSDVMRAGEQVDTTINPTQIPPGALVGEARPRVPFQKTDFWAQGLRFGLEYNY